MFKRKSFLEYLASTKRKSNSLKLVHFGTISKRVVKNNSAVACSVRNKKDTKYAPKDFISHACVDRTIILNRSFVETKLRQ